jgi:hypothetical protein
LNDTDKKFKRFEQKGTCHYDGKGVREQWSESTDNEIVNAFGEGEAAFWLSVNQGAGVYSFNFRFPEAAETGAAASVAGLKKRALTGRSCR